MTAPEITWDVDSRHISFGDDPHNGCMSFGVGYCWDGFDNREEGIDRDGRLYAIWQADWPRGPFSAFGGPEGCYCQDAGTIEQAKSICECWARDARAWRWYEHCSICGVRTSHLDPLCPACTRLADAIEHPESPKREDVIAGYNTRVHDHPTRRTNHGQA